ncbi:MAG: 23S rRNA (pseudouridine(1915)-N(3))-methyltransferase RlmH [Cyanobacteria bacterium]|nr:23S rRNA (pseudouridine(1915)-N(3))-methyltransferase RlmH [Cyanobacteriota bacterium]
MQRKIKIIAVGKVKYSWIQAGIQEYGKRIPGLNLQEIKDSNRRTELSEITPYLKTHDRLIVLTERGQLQTSQDFSQFLITETLNHSLVFVIGSSDGITPELERSAHIRLALSTMTFTHDLARLLLVEQIYRGISIATNGSYHK